MLQGPPPEQLRMLQALFNYYDKRQLGYVLQRDLLRILPGEAKEFITPEVLQSWVLSVWQWSRILFDCLIVCLFIASQHTLNHLRPQQYTTPTVYVSSELPSPHCPALHKSHTLCRLSLYPYTRVTCVMVEDYRACFLFFRRCFATHVT